MKRISGIESENFKEFIDKMDQFSQKFDVFATQTHIDGFFRDKTKFYAILWYNSDNTEKAQPASPGKESKPKEDDKGITEGQIKTLLKWSKNDSGQEFLAIENIDSEEDVLRLTSKQADKLIKKRIEIIRIDKEKNY